MINMVNDENDQEDEFDGEVYYSTGIQITPIPLFFKAVESDDD